MQEPKEFRAKIFIKGKGLGFFLTANRVMYFGIFLTLLSLSLLFVFSFENILLISLSLIGGILLVGARIWCLTEHEKKHGVLVGELIINENFIFLNDLKYSWNEINNFSFNSLQYFNEYMKEWPSVNRFNGDPAYSAGVNNFIKFYINNYEYEVFFRLESPSHKREFHNLILFHFYKGNIELYQTYDGLHLAYEEIQEIKKKKIELNRHQLNGA